MVSHAMDQHGDDKGGKGKKISNHASPIGLQVILAPSSPEADSKQKSSLWGSRNKLFITFMQGIENNVTGLKALLAQDEQNPKKTLGKRDSEN